MLNKQHLLDEYKGAINHLAYNCAIKHLPPLTDTESVLSKISGI